MLIVASGSLGTLPGWLTFAGILFAAWIFYKGGGGTAINSLQTANQVLEKRVHDLGAEVRDLKIENAGLKEQTNVAVALIPAVQKIVDEISEHDARVAESLSRHEDRAIQRHDGQLKILELIADRLGPDPNGHPQE
jgi:hypothetical protein